MTESMNRPPSMLLCLDLESDSETLCRMALEYSRRCGQPLQVLHVMQAANDEQQCRDRLLALLASCGLSLPAKAIHIETGTPEERIPEVAARCRVAPVILGRRQRSTVERIYVGSTTSAVISLCRMPVLVIPLPSEG
ncbi:universal stress protein [Thiohalobacter sp. IOR34]|uniref:universal stress protein n=1 Tax=Thiohalobacter sp. IOR34 TaxID=3057176 RepID=UPI0025AF5E99|nr:universal stress protein [Thiohalobacter sp. IOR34]WJW76362.1 universal stress protein [Thiohalobacter sp. IOR34]